MSTEYENTDDDINLVECDPVVFEMRQDTVGVKEKTAQWTPVVFEMRQDTVWVKEKTAQWTPVVRRRRKKCGNIDSGSDNELDVSQ